MRQQKVMINILSCRHDHNAQLFEDMLAQEPCEEDTADEEEIMELSVEGIFRINDRRAELFWVEGEDSGMAGTAVTLGFDLRDPGLITLSRSGPVNTAMVFEEERRHVCYYRTPFATFEVCTYTLCVDNRLLQEAILSLEYLTEFHGSKTEYTHMTVTAKAVKR